MELEPRGQPDFWWLDAHARTGSAGLVGRRARGGEAQDLAGGRGKRKWTHGKGKGQARELLPPLSALLCSVYSAPLFHVSSAPLSMSPLHPRKHLENA